MIEVTADSNIYVSALQFAGLPLRFLASARAGNFRLAISEALQEEIAGVLREKFNWTEAALTEQRAQLAGFTRLIRPTFTLNVIAHDPDDNRVLEYAVEAGSGFILTGDKDLLRLGQYRSIQIVKVADFLKLIPTS